MPRKLKEFTPGRGYAREDWDEVGDPHAPTDAQWAQAKPFAEAFPDLAAQIEVQRVAGAAVSLPIDRDIVEAYRATGPGWRERIHAVLRAALPVKA